MSLRRETRECDDNSLNGNPHARRKKQSSNDVSEKRVGGEIVTLEKDRYVVRIKECVKRKEGKEEIIK